jgi:hypothetical protein
MATLPLTPCWRAPRRPRSSSAWTSTGSTAKRVAALGRHPDTFRRSGRLVYVAWEPAGNQEVGESTIHYPAGPQIVLMSLPTLRERLTEVADWKEARSPPTAGRNEGPGSPPKWCSPAVLDRKTFPGVRPLHALADYPCFVVGGKILSKPGYDDATAIYYSPSAPVELTIPDEPNRADVAAALDTLSEVVVDFPFLRPHHKSAWLAGLLTPLARFAFRGPAPLFLVEANVPGAGKGLLVEAAHLIVRGEESAGLDFPKKPEELEKVVTALLVRGETTAAFDNIEGHAGRGRAEPAPHGVHVGGPHPLDVNDRPGPEPLHLVRHREQRGGGWRHGEAGVPDQTRIPAGEPRRQE